MSMEENNNKTATQRFYEEAINQKQLAVLDELVAANAVSDGFPPELLPGPEGFKSFVGVSHSAFPDGHVTIDQIIAEGDTVAARTTFHGTHAGDYRGIPPTGKAITNSSIAVFRFVDGKIVEYWGGPNHHRLLHQLGPIPS